MKTPEISNTIIANEILNVLESTVLSSESKNSILVDYLQYMRKIGFDDGQKVLVDDIQAFTNKNISSKEAIIGEIGKQLLEIDRELEERYNDMR